MLKRPLLWLVILGMTLVQGSCIRANWAAVKGGSIDFAALYGTAIAARSGSTNTYDASTIQGVDAPLKPSEQAHVFAHPELRTDSLHPPFEVLLFLPFTAFPYINAYLAFTTLSVLCLWAVPFTLWPLLPKLQPDFEVVAIGYGIALPVAICLLQGQDSILVLLFVSCAFVSWMRGNPALCGVFLAFGMIKFQLVVPIVAALVMVRTWRVAAGFLAGLLMLLIAAFVVVGMYNTLHYIPYVLHYGGHISSNASHKTSTMPNLRGLVALVLGVRNVQLQSILVLLLSAFVFIALVVWLRHNSQVNAPAQFSAIVCVASLVSYHYYVYNACVLLLPVLLMTNEIFAVDIKRSLRIGFTFLLVAFCSIPLVALFSFDFSILQLTLCTIVLLGFILSLPMTLSSGLLQAAEPQSPLMQGSSGTSPDE